MDANNMSFNELYNEMVKKGILPPGRTYIEGEGKNGQQPST